MASSKSGQANDYAGIFRKVALTSCAVALTLALLSLGDVANAQGLGEPFKTVGKWTVLRKIDAMTDKPSCLAIYNGDQTVQLSEDALGFVMAGKGGVSGYYLRLDALPAQDMQLPSGIEKQVGVILIQGPVFAKITSSSRVRLRVLTVLSTLVDYDIDTSQLADVETALTGAACKAGS